MMFKGDWGCFPNKQICEDCTEGKIEKMSEPVQVYTACQFARLPNLGFRKQYLRVFNSDWKKGLAQYKSNCSQLRTTDLEQENDRLRKRIRTYEDVISHHNLWGIFFETQSKNNGERHSKVIQAL